MADLFQIGLSGIYSSQAKLATTGHNIANVNTQGYSRQSVDVTTAGADVYGDYFLGNGSIVAGIDRAYDQFAYTENNLNTSLLAYSTEVYTQNNQMDMVLSGEGTSVTQPVLDVFEAINGISDNPSMLESRTVFLESASSMISQYNSLYDSLETQYTSINNDIVNTAKTITSLAESIASVNQQISTLLGSNGESNANDLLDQRDLAINELSQYVDVSIVDTDNGMQNVFIGTGQALVMGVTASELTTINGDPDASRKELAFSLNGNTSAALKGDSLGGKVAAMFETRDDDLESAFNQLGQSVIGLTHAINEQQKEGVTLEGEFGQDIFNDVNSQSAMESRVLSHSDSLGDATITVSIDDLSALTADEYELVVDVYDDTLPDQITFTVTNLTTGESEVISASDLSVDSRFDISGAGISIGIDDIDSLEAGKTFTLRPTRLGAQQATLEETDPEKVAAASAEIKTVTGDDNIGNAVLRTSDITDSSNSLYMDADNPLTINITGVTSGTGVITYEVLDNNGNQISSLGSLSTTIDPLTGKATFGFAGVEVEMIAGLPEVGDQFTLNYNETGDGDNSNVIAMVDLQTQKLMNDGKATFADVYNGMLSEIGARTANADVAMQSATILQSQSFDRIQTLSGVNMDEEAANLLQYQQYYSAAARVITVATELFDTILAAAR